MTKFRFKVVAVDATAYCGYRYNVQIWHWYPWNPVWTYAGIGRYCKTKQEAEAFMAGYRIGTDAIEETERLYA